MRRVRSTRGTSVCLLAFHPLVLSEFERLLADLPSSVHARRLEPDLIADPAKLVVPKASVFVLEGHAHRPTTEALVVGVLGRHPTGRVIVAAETFDQAAAFCPSPAWLQGTDHLRRCERAARTRGSGGRLGRFLGPAVPAFAIRGRDDQLGAPASGPVGPARLSRREREVLDALLENLSNKEIASKLNMSERTAKFHVSNLLAKYGVRRRADLILLTYTQLDRPTS